MRNIRKPIELAYSISARIQGRPLLLSVRQGLTNAIPFFLIGSMALVFMSLPIPAYQTAMGKLLGDTWKNIFVYIRDGTFNISSIIIVVSISHSYAGKFLDRYPNKVSPVIAAMVSLASFAAISGISKEGFQVSNFGVMGVFIAILVAITSSLLYLSLCSVKFLRINDFSDGADSTFNYAVTSIGPAAITITAFAILNHVLTALCGISDIQAFLSDLFSAVFSRMGSTFWRGLSYMALIHVLWFLGVHGGNILEPVARKIFVPALAANKITVGLGLAPTEIFTKTFFDTFVLMGGCGATLCLVFAIMIVGRRKNQRRLAKLSLVPMVFNINELIVFGLPIVLNPAYLIPFLVTPLIATASSYFAMQFGLVPYTRNFVEWTTPIFLSGYIATGSVSGCLLQLFNLGVGSLCYMPFVRLAERISDAQIGENIKKVYALVRQNEEHGRSSELLARTDDIGSVSRLLTADLDHDLRNGKVTLFYQPQVDYEGNVFGVEALLRWKHESFGYIYPPMIIALAEEAHLIDRLGYSIFDTACRDLKRMNDSGVSNLTMSVNISSVQLTNDSFIGNLEGIICKHKIEPESLEIEVTEQLAMASGQKNIEQTMAIKKMGVRLAMDDFGMGHSSLMYLKEYDFDTVKLDGSLVNEILSNPNCRNIITSIVSLGKSMNYSVLAEYVETEEQRLLLHELGCNKYQGYLYSKALSFDEFVEFIAARGAGVSVA
jgi:lactose/cellobiose-specific phosphotransferase system IIC component